MTRRERLLCALRHEEPDYVPNNPRIWAFLIEHYGNDSHLTHLKAAQEWDFDPILTAGLEMPNFIYSQIGEYNSFPGIKVDLSLQADERGIVHCHRTIRTPAGELQDAMIYPPSGGVYGVSPNCEKLEYMIKEAADSCSAPAIPSGTAARLKMCEHTSMPRANTADIEFRETQ